MERAQKIERHCLDRLLDAESRGLSEQVLIASLQHRCREELGQLNGTQVRKALKALESSGRVGPLRRALASPPLGR